MLDDTRLCVKLFLFLDYLPYFAIDEDTLNVLRNGDRTSQQLYPKETQLLHTLMFTGAFDYALASPSDSDIIGHICRLSFSTYFV